MNVKKIALWIGLIIFVVLIIWATPVTLKFPTWDNIIINAILILVVIAILYFLFKGDGKGRKQVQATSESW